MATLGAVLITGGPSSGKTEKVVARLAARYESNPLYEAIALVPTSRHGDQLRKRLVSRCGVALRLRVETMHQFSHSLTVAEEKLSGTVAEELLGAVAWSEAQGGSASYFRPIAHTDGFIDLVSAAVRDLLSEDVDPDAFLQAARRSQIPSLIGLSAIYASYCSELNLRSWLHPAKTPLAAADAIEAGSAVPAFVVVDSFHVFRGIELRLLQALAKRTEVVVTFDPEAGARARCDYERLLARLPNAHVLQLNRQGTGGTASVVASTASDREEQLRAIARQIKQRLTDNPRLRPSDCAVAFRQVSPYLSLARQVFAEYDLPLDPAAGERLNTRPLGVWLRRLLHLAQDGWRLRDLTTVLSSGFIDLGRWGLYASDVARFARQGRGTNLWAGRDALERIADSLRADSRPCGAGQRIADGIARALQELGDLLERPPSPVGAHALHLDNALFGHRSLVPASARDQDGVGTEIEALQGYLRDMAASQELLGGQPESFDSFVARLERRMAAPAVVLREAGGVLLAPMHTLHGLRFDYVALGGLIQGEFPAQRTGTTLLDEAAREALNQAGLTLPPEPRLAEDDLWQSASTRADRSLSLWRTRLDARGRPAAPSYYFDALPHDSSGETAAPVPTETASRRELAIACTRLWLARGALRPQGNDAWPMVRAAVRIEGRRRSFGNGDVYEGRIAAGLAPRLTGEDARWSASRLESYRTCAFQFFGKYALRLYELDEEMDAADAATRGSVIHEVLQDALAPLTAQGLPLTPATLQDALDRLRTNGPDIWNRAPSERGFGRAALWRLEAEAAFQQMELLLQREAEESRRLGVTRIIGAEREITASLPLSPPMRVVGYVDRLDEGDGLAVVVDYKSGRAIPRAHVLDGRRVQLQLYGHMARAETAAERVIARYAWLRADAATWDLDSSKADDNAVLEDVVGIAGEVRAAVEAGDFRVNPQVSACPTYCSFRHICRVNEYSRWKRWD